MAASSSSHSSSCAASSTSIRLAPTLKFSPWLPITIASKFFSVSVDAGVDHGDHVVADRVHLAVKLDAEHAVAEIDQRRAWVLLHHAAGALQFRQAPQSRDALQASGNRSRTDRSNWCAAAGPGRSPDRRRRLRQSSIRSTLGGSGKPSFSMRGRSASNPAHPRARTGRAYWRSPSAWRDRSRRCGRKSPAPSRPSRATGR